jgi:outer membrane protein TolC
MKRYFLVLILALLALPTARAQKIITLKECYDRAATTTAIAGEASAYADIWQMKDKNLTRNWLPSLDAGATFIYNSTVVDMTSVLGSLPIPGIAGLISPLPHDQYKVTADINQMIYDGGLVKSSRAVEKASLQVSREETESDIYKLKSQLNAIYFNVLLIERQKELLDNFMNLINKRLSSMESALSNGVIMKSDLDVLQAEKIKVEQQINENGIMRDALLRQLSKLTGIEINNDAKLAVPDIQVPSDIEPDRPELRLFDLRKEQLNAGLSVIQSKRMPKAYGFATLGYGNPPGNNFFKDAFEPYYIVGASVKWNIFDWNKSKTEKQIISRQQQMLDDRKADLSESLKRMLISKKAEIDNLVSLIVSDNPLIEVRKRITATAESQYNNGTLTATEYLAEINAEQQALINCEIHKIKLVMAKTEYLNISGKEIEQ